MTRTDATFVFSVTTRRTKDDAITYVEAGVWLRSESVPILTVVPEYVYWS
jgi:hypothetical protein